MERRAERMRWAGADDEWVVNLAPCHAQALPLSRLAALYEREGRRYLVVCMCMCLCVWVGGCVGVWVGRCVGNGVKQGRRYLVVWNGSGCEFVSAPVGVCDRVWRQGLV